MSGIADQVFERLRAGESPSAIRASVKSSSRFGEGLQKFLAWGPIEVERLQNEIAKLDSTNQELTDSNEKAMGQKEGLKRENDRLFNEAKERSDQLEKLTKIVQKTEKSLTDLEDKADQLREKGYTEEIMAILSESDATSGGEMLQRVQAIERYEAEEKRLTGAVNSLSADREKLSVKLKTLEVRAQDLQKREEEAINRLGKAQEEAQLFEDSVEATKMLMERYGLREKDFNNLTYLITRSGTPGIPARLWSG